MLLLNDTRSSISFNSDLICFWWPFFGHHCGPNISWDILQIDSLMPGHCLPLFETDTLAENWNQAGITQAWSAFGNAGKIGVFNDQSHLSSTAEAERLPLNNIEPCLFFRPRDRQQNTSYVRFHNQSILVKFNSLNAAAIWRFFHRRPVFVAMADSQQPRGNKKNKENHKKIQKRRKKYTWR